MVVGCTKNMDKRSQQNRSALKCSNGSSTLSLLYFLERFTGLPRSFPGLAYEYRFVQVATVEEAKKIESKLIKRYVCQFADRPPLNSAFPDRYVGWEAASD